MEVEALLFCRDMRNSFRGKPCDSAQMARASRAGMPALPGRLWAWEPALMGRAGLALHLPGSFPELRAGSPLLVHALWGLQEGTGALWNRSELLDSERALTPLSHTRASDVHNVISVHRSPPLAMAGLYLWLTEEASGQGSVLSTAWHQAFSLLTGFLTFSSQPLKSYLRIFGSLILFIKIKTFLHKCPLRVLVSGVLGLDGRGGGHWWLPLGLHSTGRPRSHHCPCPSTAYGTHMRCLCAAVSACPMLSPPWHKRETKDPESFQVC